MQCRRHRRYKFNPWVRKIPWSRKWQSTPVFLPGKFHGQRSLAGYSPWMCKELNTTERLNTHIVDLQYCVSFWYTEKRFSIYTFFFRLFSYTIYYRILSRIAGLYSRSLLIICFAYISVFILSCFGRVWLFVTPWTVTLQVPLSMWFSRREYWSGLPWPPPGDLPQPGIEPVSLMSLRWLAGSF